MHRALKPSTFDTMQQSLLLSIFLLFGTLLTAQEGVNQLDADGKKHGTWEQFYENEQWRYRGQFEHGQPVGTFFYYYDSGEKSSEVTHIDAEHSEARFFHKNGTLMGEGKYLYQQKHGEWRFYDNHTTLSSIEPFEHGKLNGLKKVYHLNGKIAAEIPFEDGRKHGPFKEYSTNGNVLIEGTYQDNQFDGEYQQYYEDGSPYIKGYYKAAVKDSLWICYTDEGRIKYQQLYKTGELIKQKIEDGFEPEEVDVEIDPSAIIDEEQLKEEFLNGGPPR